MDHRFASLLETVKKAVPGGFPYPASLLEKFVLENSFDKEHFQYLTGSVHAGGGYHHYLAFLLQYMDCKCVVELGNRYGVSTIALYAGMMRKKIALYTVDIEKNQKFIPDVIFDDDRVHFVYGDCLDLSIYGESESIPVDIDVIFSDTIHTYEQISNEFYIYEPLLADESLFIIDDIHLNDKNKFFYECTYDKYDLTDICHTSGFGLIYYTRKDELRKRSRCDRINEALMRSSKIFSEKILRQQTLIDDLQICISKYNNSYYCRIKNKIKKIVY